MRSESAPPLSVSPLQPTQPLRSGDAKQSDPRFSPTAESSEEIDRTRGQINESDQPLLARDLVIELDKEAHVFVQTVLDPRTQEVLRKYPAETQLAFARAVSAYLKAQAGR